MVLPHYLGSREIDIESKSLDKNHKDLTRQDSFSWQSPLEDIPLLLPQEGDKIVISSTMDHKLNGLHSNQNDKSFEIIERCILSSQKYKVEAFSPDMQIVGIPDDLVVLELCSKVSDEWGEIPEEGNQDIFVGENEPIGPRIACHCQVSYIFRFSLFKY